MTVFEPTTPHRDRVAEAIRSVTDRWDEPLDEVHDIPQIADALIEAEVVADPEFVAWLAEKVTQVKSVEARIRRETLLEAADAWTQGAWADTPRHAERARDRIASAQFYGDWLRDRADALEQEQL